MGHIRRLLLPELCFGVIVGGNVEHLGAAQEIRQRNQAPWQDVPEQTIISYTAGKYIQVARIFLILRHLDSRRFRCEV